MHAARHVMNPSPLVVGPRLPLDRLVHQLSEHDTDVACVVDGESLVGVVTSSDLCWVDGAPREPLLSQLLSSDPEGVQGVVADIMTTTMRTVEPGTPLPTVLELMYASGLSVLPVLGDDDRLLGTVTRRSIVRALVAGTLSSEPRILKR